MTIARTRPRGVLKPGVALLVAMLAGAIGALAPVPTALTPPTPAHAAEVGHHLRIDGWVVGSYRSSQGGIVYCIEPGADFPSGAQQTPRRATSLPGYSKSTSTPVIPNGTVTSGPASGETLRQMNYVLWTHGRTTNSRTAAAVQLALWLIRDDPGARSWVNQHLTWLEDGRDAALVERARQMAAEAKRNARAPEEPNPDPLVVEAGDSHGHGSVRYPAGTTVLTIEGGTFENGSERLTVADGQAGTAEWSADLHADGWERFTEVTIAAEWRLQVRGWPAEVVLHPSAGGDQQALGGGVEPISETRTGALEPVSYRVDSQFSPVLTTQVEERFIEEGSGRFSDTVTLSVAESSAPWASREAGDGGTEYAPIVADGTVYGPFTHPQTPADEPPSGAPIAGHARIVATDGPGEYRASATSRPDEAGYYSWVWRVRESDQQPEIRDAELLPEGYEFTDQFGLEEEGQVVPTRLRWTTELLERELDLENRELRDTVTPTLHQGAWLRDEAGERLPARLRLTVYQLDEKPTQQPSLPSGAREIATEFVTVTAPDLKVEAETIELPFETRGWVSVQTCLIGEDQPEESRGFFEEGCDDFGIPSETAQIVLPEVRTEAQPDALVGEKISDTAIVTGPVPSGATVGFAFYLQPEVGDPKYGENWSVMRDENGDVQRWSEHELATLSASESCLAQPVAFTDRVAVSGPGRTSSPEVVARSAGTGYWVEDLSMPHPETAEEAELHRGECGLANERTVITDPEEQLAETGAATAIPTPVVWSVAGLGAVLLLAGVPFGCRRLRESARLSEEASP